MLASFSYAALLLFIGFIQGQILRSIIQDREPCGLCSVAQSLKGAFKSGGDEASKVQANVMKGEYFVMI